MQRALLIAAVAILCCLAGREVCKLATRIGHRIAGVTAQAASTNIGTEEVKWIR